MQQGREVDVGQYRIAREPFYKEVRGEIGLFTVAANSKMPVMLKGPTGCGKTRFVQHMAYRLGRPLITVACHEDLTASDLVGRYLLRGQETVWVDGPLTLGVKHGAIVYLDEIVEARKDTTVIIHPLSDDRRFLPIEKKGQILEAADDFLLQAPAVAELHIDDTRRPYLLVLFRKGRCGECDDDRRCDKGSYDRGAHLLLIFD